MTRKQRENTAKYFYDISKGVFLVAVIGSFMKEKWDIPFIVFGISATILFFTTAHIFDGGDEDE